jgi:hypothetical protein
MGGSEGVQGYAVRIGEMFFKIKGMLSNLQFFGTKGE